eukprot:1035143-Pleurochrysis_carterae.AAC.4
MPRKENERTQSCEAHADSAKALADSAKAAERSTRTKALLARLHSSQHQPNGRAQPRLRVDQVPPRPLLGDGELP